MLKGLKALSYIAIMCSLNLLFLLLSLYLPLASLFLMIALPLTSALVSIKCPKRYILIYFVATSLVSLIDLQEALFYILPSLLIGISFGVLIKLKIHSIFVIYITSIVALICLYLGYHLIIQIYGVDMRLLIANLLNIKEVVMNNIFLILLYFLGLTQTVFTYMIATSELKKFGVMFNEERRMFFPLFFFSLGFSLLSLLFAFIQFSLAYLFLCFSILFAVCFAFYLFNYQQKKLVLATLIPLYVIAFFFNVFIAQYLVKETYPLMIISFIIAQNVIGLLLCLLKSLKHQKITPTLFVKKD